MNHGKTAERPLAGLKVIEIARILAGPWSGQLLADLGADVLKIESPDGDDTRRWGPPWLHNPDGTRDAAYFHATNRGKQSLVLDFRDDLQRDHALELISDADVVIENFKVGGLAKYGLDYASLAPINPGLVYCSITGFGQTGPYAHRAGYDFLIQAMSGIMDLTGDPQGPPQKMGVAFADIITGLYATVGIQAALAQRERTGKGQQIDVALFDCMVGVLANQAMNYLISGNVPKRLGNDHPNIVPYAAYPTKDGWFVLAVGNDQQFRRFCRAVGHDELAEDPRFIDNESRIANRADLRSTISGITCKLDESELLSKLEVAGVPAGPINSVADALNDPQIDARGMMLELERDSDGAKIPGVSFPLKFSDSSTTATLPSPALNNAANQK